MSMIIDGTNGLTFNNATTQASAGQVLQVVSTSSVTSTSTSSTSFVTASISASITPKFSTSKVLAIVSGGGLDTDTGANNRIGLTVYRNGATQLGTFTNAYVSASRVIVPLAYQYLDSPATTSSTSYTIYIKAFGAYTVYLNSQGETLTITLMEIAT
jgi:hypothetical protein